MIDRREGIGASEVAALSSLSPWATPVSVWMEKVGLSPGQDQSAVMSMGKVLEPVLVRQLSQDLGVPFRHNAARVRHPDWPHVRLYATPDAYGPGRRSMAEVKVVSHRLDEWRDGPPEYVRLQALGQLAVHPRAEVVHVGALIGGELRSWPVERDRVAIDALVDGVIDWWRRYVLTEVAPDPTGPDDLWALLRARVASLGGDRQARVATDEEEVAAAHLAVLMEQARDIDDAIAQVRLELAAAAEDADLLGHGWRGTWTSRSVTDWRGLAAALGASQDLVEGATRESALFTVRRRRSADANPDAVDPELLRALENGATL
jgi:predicted phage-related endonuclease